MAVVFLILVIVMHFLGAVGLYSFRWYNKFVHFVGGLFMGTAALNVGVNPVLGAFIGGVIWELFEYSFDKACPNYSNIICWNSRTYTGAVWDVVMGTLGGLTIILVA